MKTLYESCFKKTQGKNVPINSKLRPFNSNVKGEAFCRQIIPASNCARKQAFEIDALISSKNEDRRIMQNIRVTSENST